MKLLYGLCVYTGNNPLAKARGFSSRIQAQIIHVFYRRLANYSSFLTFFLSIYLITCRPNVLKNIPFTLKVFF